MPFLKMCLKITARKAANSGQATRWPSFEAGYSMIHESLDGDSEALEKNRLNLHHCCIAGKRVTIRKRFGFAERRRNAALEHALCWARGTSGSAFLTIYPHTVRRASISTRWCVGPQLFWDVCRKIPYNITRRFVPNLCPPNLLLVLYSRSEIFRRFKCLFLVNDWLIIVSVFLFVFWPIR